MMKRFSFGRFDVTESNREAFEVCRAIAELQPVKPQPVILVGDSNGGKTHLLYSILNYVRAASVRTGLAFVTARVFPEAVLKLLADPALLSRVPSAILLVDQLESFRDHLPELEQLARLFLERGHYVVMASNVQPARLDHFGPAMRQYVTNGKIVQLQPPLAAAAEKPAVAAPEAATAQSTAQRAAQVAELENLLAQERAKLATLVAQLDAEARNADARAAELLAEQARRETLASEFEQNQLGAQNLRVTLQAERGRSEALAQELQLERARAAQLENDLRQQLDAAHQRADELAGALNREIANRTAEEGRAAMLREERDALQVELDSARTQGKDSEARAEQFTAEIEKLTHHIETRGAYYEEGEKLQRERMAEIETLLQQQIARAKELEEYKNRAQTGIADLEQEQAAALRARETLESQLKSARADARNAQKERDDAREKLDRLTANHAGLELEFDELRDQLLRHEADLDALRKEAAEQVAAANARTGEVEHRYAELIEAFETNNQIRQALIAGLNTLRRQLLESSETAMKVAEGLAESFEATLPESFRALPTHEPAAEPPTEETPGEPEIKIEEAPANKDNNGRPLMPEIDPALIESVRRMGD